MQPQHSPVWLLRDGTPRWLLGGGRSLTHPGTDITLPCQLVLTARTKAPTPALLPPIRGLERHKAVKSPIGYQGSTQHQKWAPAAALASQCSTAAGTSHRNQTPQTLAARSPNTITCTSSHPYLPPHSYIGAEAHLWLRRERPRNWRAAAAFPQPWHEPKQAELPQKTLPVQLRGPTPPIILANI